MLDILKTLLDILRLKAGPEDLPTSTRLLWATFAVLVALQGALAAWLMPEETTVLPQAALSGLVTLVWLALITRAFGYPERYSQTATAVLGVACVFAPVSVPLLLAVRPDAGGQVQFSPLSLVAIALSVYLIYVNARILRAALERPIFQCVLLFMLGEFVVFAANLAAGFGNPPSG
jgi:hypothetical protein